MSSERNVINTTHSLDFETAECPTSKLLGSDNIMRFRVGTCEGQWGSTDDSFFILSIINNMSGNGHLDDVFEWFEYSCKKYRKNLLVMHIAELRFYNHLISKRGFMPLKKEGDHVIKIFNQKAYKRLLKVGNEFI